VGDKEKNEKFFKEEENITKRYLYKKDLYTGYKLGIQVLCFLKNPYRRITCKQNSKSACICSFINLSASSPLWETIAS
jgi:hypothetical protein